MGLQLRGWLIGMDTDGKCKTKEKVSVGEVHGPKGKGRKCELTENFSLHSDMLELCPKKKHNIADFFPENTVFYD